MKHSTIFTTSRLFHRKLLSVISMGAAAVLMVAGVSLMATSSAGAVGTGTTTVTTSAGPSSPQIMGTSVTISATISNQSLVNTPTGTITFEYSIGAGYNAVTGCTNPATVASNTASCVTTALPAGTVSLETCIRVTGTTPCRQARPSRTRSPVPPSVRPASGRAPFRLRCTRTMWSSPRP